MDLLSPTDADFLLFAFYTSEFDSLTVVFRGWTFVDKIRNEFRLENEKTGSMTLNNTLRNNIDPQENLDDNLISKICTDLVNRFRSGLDYVISEMCGIWSWKCRL